MNFSFHFKKESSPVCTELVKYNGFFVFREMGDKGWKTWEPCILNLVNALTKKNSSTVSSKCVKKQFYKEIKNKIKKQQGGKSLRKSLRYHTVGEVGFVGKY